MVSDSSRYSNTSKQFNNPEYKKTDRSQSVFYHLEVPTGFEPVITELQSIALPLGYGTIFYEVMVGTVGLEPTRDFSQRILSPLRLPIPP